MAAANTGSRRTEQRIYGVQSRISLTTSDIPALREAWQNSYADIFGDIPLELPPFREVNHEIKLIDPSKVIRYRTPRCPEALKEQLIDKINQYVTAGWWRQTSTQQAVPMLCLPKKTGKLRTVFDKRLQNENTVKDVTPFPDQDMIRNDVARSQVRSKIDLTEAYEQIRIVDRDVDKSAFSTIFGTYESLVMQMGDCNAPSTFQRLMTMIFIKQVGRFIHVYLDDIFVFSMSIEEHEEHLSQVFALLRANHLYLSKTKVDLYSERMDCLGHIIDDQGIHADTDKLYRLRSWRTPRSYNEILRFVGLCNYLALFLPDISAYTSPLTGINRNNRPFEWTPFLDKCFKSIKHMATKHLILKALDWNSPLDIWVVIDGSNFGVGGYIGQGKEWNTCHPAGFLSKKFTSAQQNYRTHEHEALAVLEALAKWQDKLLGRKFFLVTDNKSLTFFKTQETLTARQARWWDFISRFDYEPIHVPGVLNIVADCLSRYFKNDLPEEVHPEWEYVDIDVRLDPDGDTLPVDRYVEMAANREIKVSAVTRHTNRLRERPEPREEEADQLALPDG